MGPRSFFLIVLAALTAAAVTAQSPPTQFAPDPGPVEILPLDEVKPGMQAVAWTAFSGEGAEREVRLAPMPGQYGKKVITLIVMDEGGLSAESSFKLTTLLSMALRLPEQHLPRGILFPSGQNSG